MAEAQAEAQAGGASAHRVLAPHRALGQDALRDTVRRDRHFGPVRPDGAVLLEEHVAQLGGVCGELQGNLVVNANICTVPYLAYLRWGSDFT